MKFKNFNLAIYTFFRHKYMIECIILNLSSKSRPRQLNILVCPADNYCINNVPDQKKG